MLDDSAVTLAIVGILGTCVAGLIWVIKTMFNKIIPLVENGNKSIEKMVLMIKINTDATKSADQYLKDRNGRDAQKHEELIEVTKEIPIKMQEIADLQAKTLLVNIQKIKEQKVETQTIEHQVKKD